MLNIIDGFNEKVVALQSDHSTKVPLYIIIVMVITSVISYYTHIINIILYYCPPFGSQCQKTTGIQQYSLMLGHLVPVNATSQYGS